MRHNWGASLKKFCFLSQSLTHSVFPSSVIGHIFACICEVQLRICVYVLFFFGKFEVLEGHIFFFEIIVVMAGQLEVDLTFSM